MVGPTVNTAVTASDTRAIWLANLEGNIYLQPMPGVTLRAFGGRLDVLFNNAGVFHPHNAIDCTEEEWDATLDSSLKGAWLMSKYSLPTMIASSARLQTWWTRTTG